MDFNNDVLAKVPVLVLFIVSLLFSIVGSAYSVFFIKKVTKEKRDIFLITCCESFICGIILIGITGFNFNASSFSFLLGVVFGCVTMLSSIFSSFALKEGPWSYTTVISHASTIITALSGMVLFNNPPIGALKYVGIAFMAVCLVLSVDTKKDNGKKGNVMWFILCVLGMFASAGVGLLQTTHQSTKYKGELMQFLFAAFMTDALISSIMYLIARIEDKKKLALLSADEQKPRESMLKGKVWFFIGSMLFLGLYMAVVNVINLYLTGVVDTAIFFPIINGVPFISSVFLAFLLFKEKLTKKQWIGLSSGIIAVFILAIF